MKWILLLALAALFIFVVATVAAFVYLPWWLAILASLAVFVALVGSARFGFQIVMWNFQRQARNMLGDMGVVLRNAEAVVHGVEPVPPPSLPGFVRDADASEDFPNYALPGACYRIDVTITPKRLVSSQDRWDPRLIVAVPSDAARPDVLTPAVTEQGIPLEIEVDRSKGFVKVRPQGSSKLHGCQRLRITYALPPGWTALKFRYFSEDFGYVPLPPVIEQ